MEAFGGAVDLGYSWLETDVHTSSDGVVVCLHDDTLDRTTNGGGQANQFSYSELSRFDAGYNHGPEAGFPFRGRGIAIPTLEELVTSFPDVRVIVDLKQDGTEQPLADLVERLGLWDRLIVGSFSGARAALFRRLTGGRVTTSTAPMDTLRRWLAAGVGITPAPAHALQVPMRYGPLRLVSRRSLGKHQRAGSQVHVWTVNETDLMHQLIDWGIDGIITDRPDLLRGVLESRGLWA